MVQWPYQSIESDRPKNSKKRLLTALDEEVIKMSRRRRRAELSAEGRKQQNRDEEKRYRFTFSRLISRDIRRNFAQMHVNAVNTLDMNIVRQFFETFSRPDLLCTNYISSSIYGTSPDQICTREDLIELWKEFLICKPDGSAKLLSNQVIRHYNTKTTKVCCIVHYRATNTMVADLPPSSPSLQGALEDLVIYPTENAVVPVVHTAQHVKLTPVNVIMHFTFHLNEEHMLTKIVSDGRFVPDPELSLHYANYSRNCSHDVIVKNGGRDVVLLIESIASGGDQLVEVVE